MPIKELLVLHHSHTDIGYTHPQPVVWELHDRYIDEAIDLCEKTAAYPAGSRVKWTCEVTNVVLHWLESASPAQIQRMRQLVANGQMSCGAMLCHWTALQQEDLLQQSLQPMKELRDVLGVKFEAAMQTDVNGVAWSTADLLLDAGISHLMMSINIHMGGFPLTRPAVFRWQAPSGREITVFSGEHYNAFTREARLYQANPSVETMADGLNRYFQRLEQKGWQHDFAILTATHPVMDDNGPPNPELPEAVARWNASGKAPFIRIVSLAEVFAKIAALKPGEIPVHAGDWTDFWTNGVAASALDVVMSRRAHGALWAAKALATRLPPDAQPALTKKLCLTDGMMHLANEHTWTTYASTAALGVAHSGKMEPIPEAEQRIHKSYQCAGALSHARLLRRDALDTLAGNPAQTRAQDGLMLFNPSELPRTVCLRLTPDLARGGLHLVAGTKHRLDVIEDVLRDTAATAWFGPVTVPPLSIKTIALAALASRVFSPHGVTIGGGQITSPFWQLRFDTLTGNVISLRHLPAEAECFDPSTGFEMFGAIQETVAHPSAMSRSLRDPRYDLYHVTETTFDEVVHSDVCGWATAWQAKHRRPNSTARAESKIDAEGAHLTRWITLPGVQGEMKQTISLLAHEDRVRFEAYFNKADNTDPESLFFTFPFACEHAQAHFDTAGVAVAYDQQQLPGACRDWFSAGSFVAVEGTQQGTAGCLTLACPDAPLFQLGGFNYARRQRDVSQVNQALVMAWPTNNYWDTNFRASQPGFMRFRYELTRTPDFRAARCAKFAAAAARPVMFHPVVERSAGVKDTMLVAGLHEDVTIVSLRPAANGAALLGLRNHADAGVKTTLVFPGRELTGLACLNALEEEIEPLPVTEPIALAARATTWLRASFDSTTLHPK